MEIILSTNSDFGLEGKIGYRTFWAAKYCYKRSILKEIFCRSNFQKEIPKIKIKKVFPEYRLISLSLDSINRFFFSDFPARIIKLKVFDLIISKKIKKCDIFHSWEYASKCFKKAKELGSITILDLQMALSKSEKKDYFKYIDYFFAPSDFVKDSCLEFGIVKEKIIKIPFGVDINKFKQSKQKKNTFIVMFAGEVQYRKGIDYLLKAWEQLNLKNAKLIIAGRIYKNTKDLIRKYSKYKNIYFLGNLPTKKLIEIYQSSSIFVFPSLLEGSAKVTYEAMACGLPLITTYNSGSVARNGKDGFIIPTRNTKVIKEKIQYFYDNPSEIKRMGKNARKYVEKYTWDSYGKKIVNTYEKIFNNKIKDFKN